MPVHSVISVLCVPLADTDRSSISRGSHVHGTATVVLKALAAGRKNDEALFDDDVILI